MGCNAGLGNVPLLPGSPLVNQTWNLIRAPPGHSAFRTNVVSVADFDGRGAPLANSVIVGCLWPSGSHGVVHIATLLNETAAAWKFWLDRPCGSIAIDPNNADHLIVENTTNGAHVYESTDRAETWHTCLNQRGSVIVAIDRQGWFYGASEGGAFRNMGGCINGQWEGLYVRRINRRNNVTRDRTAHDYQRVNIDFAGGVAFGSDQGMFVMNGSERMLISADGDTNNNVIMHPAIAMGEAANETCITTALWDWSPVASWDSGKHWPSWQTPDDGEGMGYFGEGGGCFGVGKSKNVLCMHHHNVAFSSRCGKNMSRLVVPHGASVAGPSFTRKRGSRSEPSGMVYAMMTMGQPPWDALADKALSCTGAADRGDLGALSQERCLSHVDIGLEYSWWSGVNAIVWRGDTDGHCHICQLPSNSSTWNLTDAKGATVFALVQGANGKDDDDDDDDEDEDDDEDGDDDGDDADEDEDGDDDDDDDDDDDMAHVRRHLDKIRKIEWGLPGANPTPKSGLELEEIEATGNPKWVLKSWNFGANWSWVLMPPFLQGLGSIAIDPTNDTVIYGITSNCIARSYDQALTWEYCWVAPGLEGSIHSLVIKDSQTMVVMRNGQVPLRTKDGGATWHPLDSVAPIASRSPHAAYSWSGKTLAISCTTNTMVVWVSRDDGDTWVDESGDYTSDNGGIAQWYENTLYVSSMGQGISAKTFKE